MITMTNTVYITWANIPDTKRLMGSFAQSTRISNPSAMASLPFHREIHKIEEYTPAAINNLTSVQHWAQKNNTQKKPSKAIHKVLVR